MTKFLLGLDGGGTKTDVLLCTADGEAVARCVSGPASITGQTEEEAFSHIREAVTQVMQAIGGLSVPVEGFYAGISGGGLGVNRKRFHALFEELLPNVRAWDNGSDSVNALSSGIGPGDGIIATAGTGSGVFVRCQGEMRQVGGWGYLVGDEGSGYDLGRRAIMAALRDLDGRGEKTLLRKKCEEKAGCGMREFVPMLYAQDSKKLIASFAPVLLEAAEEGDPAACRALEAAAADMAQAIACARTQCDSARVVMGGSIWKNRLYQAQVAKCLSNEYCFIAPKLPPIYGSVVQAAVLAGLPCGEKFARNIEKTWIEAT